MTTTKDEINELIEVIKNIQFGKIQPLPNTATFWASTTQSLTEYRDSLDIINVTEHLIDGGLLHSDDWEDGEYIAYDGIDLVDENGEKQKAFTLFGNICALKPYEPPVEDMLEDGCFYWINLLGQKSICVWDAKHFENGAFIVGINHWHNIVKGRCEPILRDGKPIKVEVPE